MRSWPALLLAPLIVLAQQSISLALVPHACHQQTTAALHAVSAGSLVLVLAATLLALSEWRSTHQRTDHPPGEAQREDTAPKRLSHFLAATGMLVGTLSALVALFMWLPIWVLGPCMS